MSAVVGSAAGQRAGLALQGGDATTLERLARAVEKRPDLKGLVPFWTDIYRALIAGRDELLRTQGDCWWSLRRERLQNGEPQLTADDLPLAEEALRSCVGRLAAVWRQHDPSRTGEEGQDWLARVRQAFADPTLMFGQRRELSFVEALAALTLMPYLEWAVQAIGPLLEGESEPWGRGGCPVCGGRPDLALLVGDPAERRLICSRCNTAWWYPRVGCPFCGDADRQTYYAGDEERYRLYLCGACRRYLKTLIVRNPASGLDPRVERLLTIGMDLAALEAGYGPG